MSMFFFFFFWGGGGGGGPPQSKLDACGAWIGEIFAH
jgi:hypothetical protein